MSLIAINFLYAHIYNKIITVIEELALHYFPTEILPRCKISLESNLLLKAALLCTGLVALRLISSIIIKRNTC